MNEIELRKERNPLLDLKSTKELCRSLMETPHYKKMGEEGIFAIVQKAQSLGINPLEALNGGMYFVRGKVEMQAILMAKMIRSKGHSITMGKDSDKTQCTLHGKRKDNGDTWKVNFSMNDAKQAGIYKADGPWAKFPEDMLYSRALSRLARQLFPDVIGNCYIEGEISEAPDINEPIEQDEVQTIETVTDELDTISEDEANKLIDLLQWDEDYGRKVMNFLKKRFDVDTIEEMPKLVYAQILAKAQEMALKAQEGEKNASEFA